MRFLLLIAFLSIISVSYTQDLQSSQLPSTQSRLNPFSRLFGWFKRPQNHADRLTNEDFSSPFARHQSTDKLIDDTISQRILEESKGQQLVSGSSPFIQDNSDIISNGRSFEQPALNNEIVKPINDRTGYGKSVANGETESIPLAEALRIVNTSNLIDCVARVICELSCNANSYGNAGRVVFRNLIKLQFDQNVKSDDAKFFRQAATKGRQLVQGKKDCNECYSIYPSCKSSSKDLVAVSSMFKL